MSAPTPGRVPADDAGFEDFGSPDTVPFIGPERMEGVVGLVLNLLSDYPGIMKAMVTVHLALEPGYLDANGIPHEDDEAMTVADTQALYYLVFALFTAVRVERERYQELLAQNYGQGGSGIARLN